MSWWSLNRLFKYAFTDDPLTKKSRKYQGGAGSGQADALDPKMQADGTTGGRGVIAIRDSNEFVDLSTVTNRMHRYKEYDRLRAMPEIENSMTVFADEACLSGDTLVSCPAQDGGFKTLEWLAENMKDERFLVYAYDFENSDYTLAWAFNPRVVKEEETVKIVLDDGSSFIATYDHRILARNEEWVPAGKLKKGSKLMPFYHIRPRQELTECTTNQFPRIYSHRKGWLHERQFIDEWRTGKEKPELQKVNRLCRVLAQGVNDRQASVITDTDRKTNRSMLKRNGFSIKEIKWLAKKADHRTVVGVIPWKKIKVYDLSVEKYENFCTNWGVAHNCQKDENGRVFQIKCKNKEVVEELEYLLFHRRRLNLDQKKIWSMVKNTFINGDHFYEICIDPEDPKAGIANLSALPPDSMYRIETTKGRLVEFQQGKEGPDYQSLSRVEVTKATDADLAQATAIRFAPEQIVHTRIGDDRKTFYPYGVSLIEPARGPAHQLRMMEDAMIVYRLCIRTYDKITLKDGWKYMKDVSVGDVILTYNQVSKKLEEANVIWHSLIGKKWTYKVRSKHTSVIGTKQHPIIVYDSETGKTDYVKIKDIIPGRHFFVRPQLSDFEAKKINRYYKTLSCVLSKNQLEKYKNTVYLSKKKLIEEALEKLSIEKNQHNINQCWAFLASKDNVSIDLKLGNLLCKKFDLGKPIKKNKGEKTPGRINLPQYVTEEFAALFGFLVGDGCINWHKRSAKLLFAAGTYPELNKKYCNLLRKFFGKCRLQQDKRLDDGLGCYCTNSTTACEILENMGFTGGAHEKRIPDWVYRERPEIRKAFIQGLADADGTKRGMQNAIWSTTIRLCNKELVEDIKHIWESLGYHASEVKEIEEPERWIKGTLIPAGINWEVYLSETEVPFHDEIISVRKEKKEDVYDITVEHPTEHNFICNGVPVSNSRAPERRVFYIDIAGIPSHKAEAFMERIKDQFKKKKVAKNHNLPGASSVEERWHAPAADEDYWIPIRPNTQTRVETLPGACLSLDTGISLLDGRNLTLREVIKEFEEGKQLWTYSCDPNTGKIAPGKITWAGVTRKNAEVMQIKLDNDEIVTCTPDHKFPIMGRGFVEAKDLKPGDRLIPFNKKLSKIRESHNSTYEQFYDPYKKKWVFTHRMVAEFFNSIGFGQEKIFDDKFKNSDKNTIHHLDLNRYNNNPENLVSMNNKDHAKLHEWLSSEYAQIGGKARAAQIQDWKEKNDPKYQEFVTKSKKIFKEWRQNLTREERKEINKSISNGIKRFWKELNPENRAIFEKALKERGLTGSFVLRKLLKDPTFKIWFGNKISKGFDKFRNTPQYQKRSEKISIANKLRWQDSEYKKSCFIKQTIIYPKQLMDFTQRMTKEGYMRKNIINAISQNKELLSKWKHDNTHIKRKNVNFDKFTVDHFEKMVKSHGYQNWKQLKNEVALYNHQIVSVEFLKEKQDVGTITVDGNEDFHGFHTFALSCGVFTKNSNLGEIDDTVYFRNKLFIALNFPKNYFNNDDTQTTRVSLSSLDIKFARMIERLQSHIEDSFYEICERHLRLMGYPEELWEDLEVKMTPPSDWRELTRAEVVSTRIQNAGALKGSGMMADFDILTKWMHYNEDETKLMLARLKLQKLEELKFQIVAQNPQLLGVGLPGPDEQQVGTEPGEQNPMLGGTPPEGAEAGMPPGTEAGGMPPSPEIGAQPNSQPSTNIALPNPSEDELRKYDLGIRDYGSEMDEPEVDDSEEF